MTEYLDMSTLHRKEAIRAFCFDCCSDMIDGNVDCRVYTCPFYAFQPYAKGKANLVWVEDGRFQWVVKGDAPSVKGKIGKGGRPSRRIACDAKCCDCMAKTKQDCQIVGCPIYKWMRYRKLDPDITWRIEGSHLQKNRKKLRRDYRRAVLTARANAKGMPVNDHSDGWEDGWEDA